MPANLLFSMGEYFSLKHIPFLGRSRIPFEHEEFFRNSSLLSTSFYSRQLAVVYGVSGSGKTSLISYATNTLDPSAFRICHIELCEPQKRSVYRTIATKMGLRPAFYADDIKEQIIRFFRSENEQGKFCALIIDEAHSLSIPLLEELRSFYEEGGNFSLVLCGLPALVTNTLSLAINAPFRQRINLFIEISNLTLSGTQDYIRAILKNCGSRNEIFDEKCYSLIHSNTSGVPRRINQLCYQALLHAFLDKRSVITSDDFNRLLLKMPHVFQTGKDTGTNAIPFES